MFRDQTKDVARKTRKMKTIVTFDSPLESMAPCDDGVSTHMDTTSSAALVKSLGFHVIPIDLSVSAEDQAACFFFSNCVFEDSAHRGYLSDLPNVYKKAPPNSSLSTIVSCLGMAGLSSSKNAPGIMRSAASNYSSVLRSINASLIDPAEAKSDETLTTVLLMGLYEVGVPTEPSHHPI